MKIDRLVLNGQPDDLGRLEEFCSRLTAREYEAGARLRTLAVKLARREELEVTAVAHEDEWFEIEVIVAGERPGVPVSIDRDGTGSGCQLSWDRWAAIDDDAVMEKTAQMIAAVVVGCAASE